MTTTSTATGTTTTATPTTGLPADHPQAASVIAAIVVSTPAGDRIDNAGLLAWAQSAALLTTDAAPVFTPRAVQNPVGFVQNFAHGVFNAAAFQKELEKQAIQSGTNSIVTELDVINRVNQLLHAASLAGFTFTVTEVGGKFIPAAQKSVVVPTTAAAAPGASTTVPVSPATGA